MKTSKASKPKKDGRSTQAGGNSCSPIKKGAGKVRRQKHYALRFLLRFREEVEPKLDEMIRELMQGGGNLPEDELR